MSTTVQKTANQPATARRQEYLRPYYEVSGNGEGSDVRVFLPGVPKDGTSITLEKDTLVIEGNRRKHWNDAWRPVHREIPDADYRLRLQLNMAVNESGITATHRDGILTVHLPVAEEAKPRTIAID